VHREEEGQEEKEAMQWPKHAKRAWLYYPEVIKSVGTGAGGVDLWRRSAAARWDYDRRTTWRVVRATRRGWKATWRRRAG
jgi:hypothetical protein